MITFPNAKINLGLHITEKRDDGYHNIESVFYPVPCTDVLEIIETNADADEWVFYGKAIPGNLESNLIYKALELLRNTYSIPPLKIVLQKEMVMGGGIGGGSADGAFMLKLLNDTFQLKIPTAELEQFALQLGSDCPFFIENQPKYVTGRGEVLESIALNLKGKFLVLLAPDFHISTQEAYKGIVPNKVRQAVSEIIQMPIEQWRDTLCNDFEKTVFERFPQIGALKESLYQLGAVYASLTGTGACVYGIFNNEPSLPKELEDLMACKSFL